MRDSRLIRSVLSCMFAAILSISITFTPQQFAFAAESGAAYSEAYDAYGAEQAGEALSASESAVLTTKISEVSTSRMSRGTVYLELTVDELKAAGYEAGDLVSVKIGESKALVVPFVEGRTGTGFRKLVLRSASRSGSSRSVPSSGIPSGDIPSSGIPSSGVSNDKRLTLRMSDGNFAEEFGITAEQVGTAVTVAMAEKGGYLTTYKALDFGSMSNKKEDFPDLSDEEFANHRMVTTTGMKKGVLYRTSSPINPMINRSKIADEANRKAGVTTVINLSESEESAAKREGYAETYYATSTKHIEVDMKTDFGSDDFNERLVRGLRFMNENPGVFEVNCIFGKDRTGFVIAVLECLAGASYDELIADYAATYPHYYPDYTKYEPLSERDRILAEENLIAQLEYAYGVSDLKKADLREATSNYLIKAGMTSKEIAELIGNISTKKITPKKTKIKSLKKAKTSGKVTVKWKKQTAKVIGSHISGYQLQLATNSKFTKNKKTVTVKGYKKTSKTVKGLKKGKKYYVRIRTYKTLGGRKYYSSWSKAKSVKTK